MLRGIFLLFFIGSSVISSAQNESPRQLKLYYSEQQLRDQQPGFVYNYLASPTQYRYNLWKNDRIRLVFDDTVFRFNYKTVYAFSYDQRLYRLDQRKEYVYAFRQENDFVLYVDIEDVSFTQTTEYNYYFSRGITGKTYLLTRKNIRKVFADSPAFLADFEKTFGTEKLRTAIRPLTAKEPDGKYLLFHVYNKHFSSAEGKK
jgi:hypothetical protein